MLIFFLTLFCRANAQILSIDLIPAYKSQRECAMNCFDGVGNYKAGYDIATELSCTPYNAPGNACVCRSDLQTPAVDALSSCVLVWCHAGADLDVSSATQIYKDYCTSAGYTQKAANVPAKTTDVTLATTTSSSRLWPGAQTATSTSKSDVGANSAPSSAHTSGQSLTTWIGIIGGVLGAIASAGTLYWGYRRHQRMKAASKEESIGRTDTY